MCGILFAETTEDNLFITSLETLYPRGPDECDIYKFEDVRLGHTRLAIVDQVGATQPMHKGQFKLIFSGEIYNHESDGKYIFDMVGKHGPLEAPKYLEGIFAYVLYDIMEDEYYIVRDHVGVMPLYMGYKTDFKTKKKGVWVASELKALEWCEDICVVPPGYVVTRSDNHRFKSSYPVHPTGEYNLLRDLLIGSVKRRIPKVPWGVLLSGGLDSSILCGILSRIDRPKDYPTIHSFTIGLKGSPDLLNARKQAEFCGTIHHEFTFTLEEGAEAINDTIHVVETYDVTTVRASVPQYLLGKIIKKFGIRVILSGEGADELFAGYLYNKHCPCPDSLQAECIRKMENLHYYDCCRTNKTMAANGIECRVPFLDQTFVRYAMNIHPKYKMSNDKIEKHILREAFKDMLHPDIYKRQKAQFSDAVGSDWIEFLQDYMNDQIVPDKEYEHQPPVTREAKRYRYIFENTFVSGGEKTCKYHHDTVACSSSEAHKWHDFECDPSAKSLYK